MTPDKKTALKTRLPSRPIHLFWPSTSLNTSPVGQIALRPPRILHFPTMSSGSVPLVVEDAVSQLQQRPAQQHPQGHTHHAEPHVDEPLQAGAQRQAEGQLEQQRRQVPQPPLQALIPVPRGEVRLAASRHLHDQHEDEDGVKGPHREEDEEPVPVDLGVQLEDQHDEEDEGEDPGEEHSLGQGHLH